MAAMQRLASSVPKMFRAVQDASVSQLQLFWKFAKVELRPPAPSEAEQIKKGFINLLTATKQQKWRALTVKEATVNTLVAAEVMLWFFAGECIGKGSITGYQIAGAVDFEAHI
jgi:F-type H+-transporting ATPase subunit g